MIKTVAPALKALVENLIDYAGLFPPASVPLEEALANYKNYEGGERSWMLNWFVVPGGDLEQVPGQYDRKLSVLGASDCDRAATIESKAVVEAQRPVYCEVAPGDKESLDKVKSNGNYAKIRCGGVVPEAIPSVEAVRDFILDCADRKLAFKATAGLHHPLRAEQALTYADAAPRAVMHGFINVLLAAAFAWHGDRDILPILKEEDAGAFRFDDRAHYKDRSLSLEQIKAARKEFLHSIGSCSFKEPVEDLETLGLL